MTRLAVVAIALALPASLAAGPPPGSVGSPGEAARDTCVECHQALDEPRLHDPAAVAEEDIHHRQGVTCAGCHGGDATADDPDEAMDPRRGFVGKIAVGSIPSICGACHADAAFMLRYGPNIPTDQLAQYRTSRHGQALATGATDVATCASCHGAHGIRQAGDARSPVYPTRIVDTCGACHADAAHMRPYGIAGDEVAKYKTSVHYAALVERNDLSAPTCNDCHGSHGATPPGIESVANVCGTCHATQQDLFDSSPHKEAFVLMEQPACETCHSNHAIVPPSDDWLDIGADGVCAQCHSADDPGGKAAGAIHATLTTTTALLGAAAERVRELDEAGMLMEAAEVQLEEAHQAVVLARNAVHTVSLAAVTERTGEVGKAANAALEQAREAEAELRYRRRGLAISLVLILLAMTALVLKLRQMNAG